MARSNLIPKARQNPLARGSGSLRRSPAPHLRADVSTRSIMSDVLIALSPMLIVSVFFYGFRTLALTLTSVASCIAFEWLFRRAVKKPVSVGDLSAVVTGVLLAYNLPASVPYWIPVVGAAFAILIVKQLYGGIGKNFLNPALAGKAFLLVCFPDVMQTWTQPFEHLPLFGSFEAETAANPLEALKNGLIPDDSALELLLGRHAGALGETCALLLLFGGLYLILRRVISARIPLVYLGTVAVVTLLFPLDGARPLEWMTSQLLSGSLVLAAFFMATDYTTSPVTPLGQTVYAVGCGLVTVFLRYFGGWTESVCFAILIMNSCAWLVDRIRLPQPRGGARDGR